MTRKKKAKNNATKPVEVSETQSEVVEKEEDEKEMKKDEEEMKKDEEVQVVEKVEKVEKKEDEEVQLVEKVEKVKDDTPSSTGFLSRVKGVVGSIFNSSVQEDESEDYQSSVGGHWSTPRSMDESDNEEKPKRKKARRAITALTASSTSIVQYSFQNDFTEEYYCSSFRHNYVKRCDELYFNNYRYTCKNLSDFDKTVLLDSMANLSDEIKGFYKQRPDEMLLKIDFDIDVGAGREALDILQPREMQNFRALTYWSKIYASRRFQAALKMFFTPWTNKDFHSFHNNKDFTRFEQFKQEPFTPSEFIKDMDLWDKDIEDKFEAIFPVSYSCGKPVGFYIRDSNNEQFLYSFQKVEFIVVEDFYERHKYDPSLVFSIKIEDGLPYTMHDVKEKKNFVFVDQTAKVPIILNIRKNKYMGLSDINLMMRLVITSTINNCQFGVAHIWRFLTFDMDYEDLDTCTQVLDGLSLMIHAKANAASTRKDWSEFCDNLVQNQCVIVQLSIIIIHWCLQPCALNVISRAWRLMKILYVGLECPKEDHTDFMREINKLGRHTYKNNLRSLDPMLKSAFI